MKILIDMNLSPDWVMEFQQGDIEATHWSTIGPSDAPDSDLMNWAKQHEHIVFTHDLDFGTILALYWSRKTECGTSPYAGCLRKKPKQNGISYYKKV